MRFLLIILSSIICNAQLIVIANSNVEVDSISIVELLDIYTLNQKYWESGESITVVDIKGMNKSKTEFYKTLDLSESVLKKQRLKKLFTGKAKPPKTVSNEEEILNMVADIPGCVAYIDKKKLIKSDKIKIIELVDN